MRQPVVLREFERIGLLAGMRLREEDCGVSMHEGLKLPGVRNA
jgi:hypothetical protein